MRAKAYSCKAIPPKITIKNAEEKILKESVNYKEFFSLALKVKFLPSRREKFIELLISDNGKLVNPSIFKDMEFKGCVETISKEKILSVLEIAGKAVENIIKEDLAEEKEFARKEILRMEKFMQNTIKELEEEIKKYEREGLNILQEAKKARSHLRYISLIKKYEDIRKKMEKIKEEVEIKRENLREKLENWKKRWGFVEYVVEIIAILYIKIPVLERESVFTNEFCEKNFTYIIDPISHKGIKCLCGNTFTQGYLTTNGNLVCEKCALKCKECDRYVSIYEEHGICNECLAPLCPEHTYKCSSCGKSFCSEHIYKCSFCDNYVCNDDLKTCEKCGKNLCNEHAYQCSVCEDYFCPVHIRNCSICGNFVCEKHYHRCSICGKYVCENCAIKKDGVWICKECVNSQANVSLHGSI